MLLLVLAAALLLAEVQASPDENLAVGRPSLVSSSAVPPASCTTGSHLEVDAGVANVSDDCGCVLTGGWTPPNLRDWYAVQLAETSLVRGVRLTGVTTSFDVLVGDDFSANMSLDAFSLCATNVSASSAQNVSCTRANMGSVLVLRALDDSSPLRLCEVEVIGLSGNVLLGSTDIPWQPPPSSAIPHEQLWRLADGDVSSCADFYLPALFAYGTTTRIRIPAGKSTSLQVFVYHHNVPLSAFVRDSCREARFSLSIISEPSPSAGRGSVCDLVDASAASSFAQFQCSCPQACQGELAISTFSRTEQTWTLCQVIVLGSDAVAPPVLDECAAPMGSVGVSGDIFDDIAWSASSSASCAITRFARFNFVPSLPSLIGGWCPSSATPSWIALDLGTPFKLRAVIVQGSGDAGNVNYNGSYVTSFSVSFALGQAAWTAFAPSGSTMLFSGPSHPSTPALRSFSPEIVASRIRLDVLQWVKYPCVRFELLGCPLVDRAWTSSPIPSVSGALGIPNSAISSTSTYASTFVKENVRLTSVDTCAYGGGLSMSSAANGWVEVRLAASRTVHGIAWRGLHQTALWQFVTTYNLQSKLNDNAALTSYSSTPLATNLINNYMIVYTNFIPAFDAQTVRLVPIGYITWKAIRLDLYTAPVRPTLIGKKLDTPCPSGYRSLSGSSCYRYVNQSKTYADADQFCTADSGHLARVTDYDEWNALTRWLPRQSNPASCVWIGGQSTGGSNDSFRLAGSDQVLSVWDTTMPVASLSAAGSSALCLRQASSFALSSTPASEQHEFLCEKDLPSSPPTPVGLWPFDAINAFRDLSPFRQHATPGSGVSSAGYKFDPDLATHVYAAMVYLDNTANAYVDIPMSSSVDLSRDLTLLLYANLGSQGPLVYFRDPAGLVPFFGLRMQGSLLTADFPRQSDRHVYTCSSTMSLNAQHVIAATYSQAEGKGRLYLDGRLACTVDVGAGELLLVSSQLRLGYSNTAVYSPATIQAYLSCLQLYDRVLRLHEMDTAMKRCGRNTLQGLLGFWPLNSDLSNYVHRLHPATSPTAQFVSGPSYLNLVPVSAVQTDGSTSTALTISGPLNVNGPFTLLLHTKMVTSTGTLVSLLNTTSPALTVTTTGTNVSVAIAGSIVAAAPCLASGQWSQLVLRVDVLSSTLSVHCNASQMINASLTSSQLSLAQSFTQMQLAPSVSASLSCVLLFERILTPLEISSYLFYCPFQPDTPLPKRSPPRRHCGEWLSSGFKRSDLYVIDPDGTDGPVEPFTVFCDMADSNDVFKAATVVRHMIPARTLVNGSASALSIQFPISYEANTTQLKALMSVSAHCRQWLQYECNGSAIYSGTTQMAGWYSRLNDLQPGWSGVPSGAAGCTCYRRGQCAGGATAKCNCDMNDIAWRQDGGWIEDMDLLPVSQLAFGAATQQNGFFTLGNLTCFG